MDKQKRINELINEKRISYGDDGPIPDHNRVRGLYELIQDWFKPNFVVVEIGSCEGSSTELFALTCKHVYAIDPWDKSMRSNSPIEMGNAKRSEEKCRERLAKYDNVEIIKGFSEKEVHDFKDKSVDAVYVDGAHDAASVRQDILLWLPKIKDEGIMCGHDWTSGNVRGIVHGLLGEPGKTYVDASWAVDLKKRQRAKMQKDEFNWDQYPAHHAQLKARLSKSHTQLLTPDNHELIKGMIVLREGVLPLHAQHKVLYETVLELNPSTVHEAGCGWGDHLANINLLNKDIFLFGSDISDKMIEETVTRHPFLNDFVWKHNITEGPVTICDMVFTQAVLLHLSDSNLEKAIRNITASAKKHILLMENLERRNYPEIFRRIGPLGWENAEIKQIERYDAKIIIISKC